MLLALIIIVDIIVKNVNEPLRTVF